MTNLNQARAGTMSDRICRTCRHWTAPTAIYYGTCHNTLAGLGAHIAASGDGTCNHHSFREGTNDLTPAKMVKSE